MRPVSSPLRARLPRPPRALGALAAALVGLGAGEVAAAPRWTGATVDETVDRAFEAARQEGPDALARLVLAAAMHQEASHGKVREGLLALGAGASPLAHEARWRGRVLEPAAANESWRGDVDLGRDGPVDAGGMVTSYAILGPFEDTGGGLGRREGPERADHDFTRADFSWGTFEVRYRRSLPASVTARGLPLDLYVAPRKESCSYLSSLVTVPPSATNGLTLHVAASGAFRATWDGADVVTGEEVQPKLVLDRAAVRLATGAGAHVLTLKVCTAALLDAGRVRVHFADAEGRPVAVATSSDLAALQAARACEPPTTSAERVPTLLEQTLALGDAPSLTQRLAAAVVRSLGGAENLRSAQAPGLLDHVAGAADTTADELGLAATLSQFGANRSGWLNQALERARDAGDEATVSFSLRALTRSRLGAQLSDLAHATLGQLAPGRARDPEARLLRARVLLGLGGSGLREQALRDLVALSEEQGDRTPLATWRTLAQLTERTDPMQHLALRQRLAALQPDAFDPAYVAAFEPLGAAEVVRAARRVLCLQSDGRQVASIAGRLLDAGRRRAAAEAYALAAALSPNLADAHRGLGHALYALGAPANDERARAALDRARALKPGDAGVAAEIDYRKTEVEQGARPRPRDEAYLEPPATFLTRGKQRPARVGLEFERELHWRRVVTFHEDKRVSQLMHYAREIVVEPRTEGERYERFPARGPQTELVLARVHRTDGSVVGPQEQDASGPRVLWPKLHTGDVVEVAVRTWTPGPVGRRGDAPFYFIDYVGSTDDRPVLYNEVVIDAPVGQPLPFDVLGGKPDKREDHEDNGRRVTRLAWEAPPVVPAEPFAPPLSERLPVVVGSAFPSWEVFLGWYRGATAGFTEPDEQIRRLAEKLTAGATSRTDKVERLFDFVADDIRYVNFVSGEWWLPNRPQQLLARRQGDCDDKAMLLISLLKAVGIQATEVLMQTRHTSQPSILRSEAVAVPMFDHGIIYLHGDGQSPGRYLDATSPESRIGPLPSMDSGAMALFVEPVPGMPAAARPIDTPAAGVGEHGSESRLRLELRADGAGTLTASERHTGDLAFMLRHALRQPDARAQWVEQHLVSDWFPAAKVAPDVSFDTSLPAGAALLGYHADVAALARREGEELIVTAASSMPFTTRLAPLVERTQPVLLPMQLAPRRYTSEIEIVPPDGFELAPLPPDVPEQTSPFGTVKLVYEPGKKKDTVVLRREVGIVQGRIPVADYKAWRAWLQGIDRMMQLGVRFVPKGKRG
ncbi:MAG: transglutaminase domain-containing protein [Myxococcales bacterium]|nr:transglutaminase domain-containing protein [Myxococcales bacterium]